jgi:hypothetical protein
MFCRDLDDATPGRGRLIAFRSVSSNSNLDCIEFIRNWLATQGIALGEAVEPIG